MPRSGYEDPIKLLKEERDHAIYRAKADIATAQAVLDGAKAALHSAELKMPYIPNDLQLYGNAWTDVVKSTAKAGLLIDLAARVAP